MSLDVTLTKTMPCAVYDANITHNLGKMAEAAGIYNHLWHPETVGVKTAGDLIEPLQAGLKIMLDDPEKFKQFDSPNGWGTYDHFVPWILKYLNACIEHPDAEVSVSR